jgi:excisionase family DNA binding protein
LLNVKEAAKFLGINFCTLIDWVYSKRYPGLKSINLGGARRFVESDLMKFIGSREETISTGSNSQKHKTPKEGVS